MNEIITEKNYPIQGLWVFKSSIGPILGLIFLVLLFLPAAIRGNIRISYIIDLWPFIIAVVIIALIPLSFGSIIRMLRRATFHYSIEDNFLTLKQGILSKQERHIPYGVIQNLFVKQDLFDKIFGLASLTIENASEGAGSLAAAFGQKILRMQVMRVPAQQRQQDEMVGFFGNKVNIPGLTKSNAEILKVIVLQKMKENPIEDSQSGL